MNTKTIEEEMSEKWQEGVIRLAEEALLEEKPEDWRAVDDMYEIDGERGNSYKREQGFSPSKFDAMQPVDITEITEEEIKVEWIWEGFLGAGLLTLFSALWKIGKSTFLSYLLKAMQADGEIAGMRLKNTKTLIISEESLGKWGERREELGLEKGIFVISRPLNSRLVYKEWVEFLHIVSDMCKEREIKLLIIDTLAGFWPVIHENDAGEVGSAMLPFNPMLADGVSILLVHHFRKSGGEDGTAARGSGALSAATDINIDFNKLESAAIDDHKRVIRTHSRFWETPIEVVIELEENGYKTRGSIKDVTMEGKLEKTYKYLAGLRNGLGSAEDVHETWKINGESVPTIKSVRSYLNKLVDRGSVSLEKDDLKGSATKNIYQSLRGKTLPTSIGDFPVTLTTDPVLSDPPDPEFLKAQRMMLKERSL